MALVPPLDDDDFDPDLLDFVQFFKGPLGVIPNSVGKLGPGLDTRGDDGYVLAPPSWHPNGRRYSWSVDSEANFTSAPPWLYAALAECAEAKTTPVEEWRAIAGNSIAEGMRNETLTRLAGHLLRISLTPMSRWI